MFGIARKGHSTGAARKGFISILALFVAFGVFTAAVFGGFAPTAAQAQGKQFAVGSVVATTATANLLDQPASNGAVVASEPVNTKAMVIGGPFNDGWYWLDFNGTRGYLQDTVLVLVDENYTPVPEVTATNTPVPQKPINTPIPQKPTKTAVPPRATNTPVPPATATSVPTSPAVTTPATSATPDTTVPQAGGVYTDLWLGEMATGGNVRVGPGLDQKVLKGWGAGRRVILYQQVTDSKGAVWYRVSDPPEDPMWVHSSLIRKVAPIQYQPGNKFKGKWVDVSISQQVVVAYDNAVPVKVTLASTGKAPNTTEIGTWKIYYRLTKQEMKGGSKAAGDYYDLKDVPWVQYFHISGEALHGTYWHDDFGHPHSHGCVNLSTPMAQWFYGWANIGTVVNVHQ
jgi:lipoprotein-anchoring transpeptidase ErfK/SrfK